MTIHTTQWSPDTCGCVFEYTWDDSKPESSRTHDYTRVVEQCAYHSHLQGNSKRDMYDSVLEENRRKNGTIFELLDKAGADFAQVDPESGSVVLKNGVNVTWTWSGTAPNRVMTLTASGVTLSPQKKATIQTFLDNKFGVGKVIFQSV